MIRCLALTLALVAASAVAQPSPGPQPMPPPPPIAAPQDRPYPGVLTLEVDASDTFRRIYQVRQTIPVAETGRLTLLYPKWVPGGHSPRNPIRLVAGLSASAGGRTLRWERDAVEPYAIHVEVPAGVRQVELRFQYLSPTDPDQGQVAVAPNLLSLKWLQTAFYPAGYFVRQIPIEASVTLPAGWIHATALEEASRAGATVRFRRTTFETLMDSPLLAGRYFEKVALDPAVTLAIAADRPENLKPTRAQLDAHRALVTQADLLFGKRHFDRYTFLLWLSDTLGGEGLEHHRSSENGVEPGYFTGWDTGTARRSLLPHEYVHSWNGKYRRGADAWTPSYDVPMRNSLLWVYEGQTQFWGEVLAARSGIWSKDDALGALAMTAAVYGEATPGRAWKPVADTINDPQVAFRASLPWRSWQRSEDYYEEGKLIWLEADTLIRERTAGRRSMDDFARAFFGSGEAASYVPVTYRLEDVAATLDGVMPMDWLPWLRERVEGVGRAAPLEWIGRGGYRLAYTDTPTGYFKSNEARRKIVDLSFGPGFAVGEGGKLAAVVWDSPAFKAGLTRGTKLISVNGFAYNGDGLKDAVRAKTPLSLEVQDGERVRTVQVDYRGGLRYPRLERVAGAPDRLGEMLAPRR